MQESVFDRLSLADVFAESIYTEWATYDEDTGEPAWRPVLPYPDESTLDEWWPEWREESDVLAEAEDTGQTELGAALDLWDEGRAEDRARGEWEDSFWPLMNFRYPISLRHDADARQIAQAIDKAAGCVSLVEGEDERGETVYALALTGGGMDLSWNICAAYVAAGNVPPLRVLRDLPHMSGNAYGANVREEVAKGIMAAMRRASDHLRHIAGRLDSEWESRVKGGDA